MNRYTRIQAVTFGQADLPLPLSVSVSRGGRALPAGGDGDVYATSIEIDRPAVTATVNIRQSAVAEGLAIGQQGDLSFIVAAAGGGAGAREITLHGAVLIGVEIAYRQNAMAVATLQFAAETESGSEEPFSAEDTQ